MTHRPRSRSPARPPPTINVAGLTHGSFFGADSTRMMSSRRPSHGPTLTQRSVIIIVDFRALAPASQANPYYVNMNLHLYEHLTETEARALYQHMRYIPATVLHEYRFHRILEEVSRKIQRQWQVRFPASDLELHVPQDPGNSNGPAFFLDPDLYIVSFLNEERPGWLQRQPDGSFPSNHISPSTSFVLRLKCQKKTRILALPDHEQS